jgi:hypothetical protein
VDFAGAPAPAAPARRWRRVAAAALVVLAGTALAGALALRGGGVKPDDRGGEGGVSAAAPEVAPLRIKLRVEHVPIRTVGGREVSEKGREVGKDSFAVAFADGVRLEVELAEPAYAYLLTFNADGSEQLLWPVDAEEQPSKGVRPPRRRRLEFPTLAGKLFRLRDDQAGGVQVFAVLASRGPLPAYGEWRKARGPLPWKKQKVEGVWVADARGTYPCGKGSAVDRGTVEDWPGMPPLTPVCRALRAGGVEQVEALAFPVAAKEGGR